MNRSMAISALVGVAVAAVPCGADVIFGSVLSHNGSATSLPPGTGEVDVLLVYGGITFGPHDAFYNEVAVHEVRYAFPAAPATHMLNDSTFTNLTDTTWVGFRIRLEGADFGGRDANFLPPVQARADNPVIELGLPPDYGLMASDLITHQPHVPWHPEVSSSAITRLNNQGSGFRDAELILWFDAPFQPGWEFGLWYYIIPSAGVPNLTEFTGYFEPIPIPEPATAVLLGVAGLIALAGRRRTH